MMREYVGVCMCGPVLSFHQAYMYNKRALANPYASSHIPKNLLPKILFSHLLLESIGAPEYQCELLSVMPPPRGSAMNG